VNLAERPLLLAEQALNIKILWYTEQELKDQQFPNEMDIRIIKRRSPVFSTETETPLMLKASIGHNPRHVPLLVFKMAAGQ
jgi:hypothetical protein